MTLQNSKTKRYCHSCHTRHGFQRDCHEIHKQIEMGSEKPSNASPNLIRKRKHGDIILKPEETNNPSRASMTRKKPFSVSFECQSCPVCLEVRGKQQKLGCGHGLCCDCYQGIITSDCSSKCPLCRAAMFRGESCSYRMYSRTGGYQRMYQLSARRPVTDDSYSEDDSLDEYGEYNDYDEQHERDFSLNMETGDHLLLNEAVETLSQWKTQGGDLISHEMESVAHYLTSGQHGGSLAERYGIKMNSVQASLVSHLVEIYSTLYTVSSPEDPYGRYGLIIGELRRVFGYASWVTEVDLEALRC
jgi:hypothetical protein